MSRAEQIFVCTHIIQVLCITQRALHFISFQMFCSALVSLCIDVYSSHTYHSRRSPLSCSQSPCSSPGMLPKSLSSVQSSGRMWDSPLCFISWLKKQPHKRPCSVVRCQWDSVVPMLHASELKLKEMLHCNWSLPKGKAGGQSRQSSAFLREVTFSCSQTPGLVHFFGPVPVYLDIQSNPLKGQVQW